MVHRLRPDLEAILIMEILVCQIVQVVRSQETGVELKWAAEWLIQRREGHLLRVKIMAEDEKKIWKPKFIYQFV